MTKEELKFGAPPAKAGAQSPALTYMADKASRASPSARTERELQMWHTWNDSGRKPEHLEPLLKAYEPIFSQKVRQWSAGAAGVNPMFMRAQVEKHFIDAVGKFDPSRGYALATHVDKPMNKAQRARNTVQNAAYVSEETARTIAPIQNATAELHAELGRMPTPQEIATRSGLGLRVIKRHQLEIRKDVAASAYENDPTENPMNRAHDIAPLLREQFQQPGFQPHVLHVFDHTFGLNGAPTDLSGGQLAKKLGVSPSAISQAKSLILAETKKYLLYPPAVHRGPSLIARGGPLSFPKAQQDMAHELAIDSLGAQMLYAGETPWHGLGTKIEKHVTSREALAICRADYAVKCGQLFTSKSVPVNAQYIYREDAEGVQTILGHHVGMDYTPLQNVDAFTWFDPFLESGMAAIEAAGVLRDGARVWVLARIEGDPLEILPGDVVVKRLLLSNDHSGMQAARVGLTPIRTICANTLAMAYADKRSQLLRVKHTRNIKDALAVVRETIDVVNNEFKATAEQYRRLTTMGVVEKDIEKYVKLVFAPGTAPDAPDEQLVGSSAGKRVWEQIKPLLEVGRGASIPGVRGTMWSAFNAVVEYVDHSRGRSRESRLESQWFKDGAALTSRALKLALQAA